MASDGQNGRKELCDGPSFQRALAMAAVLLEQHAAEINALNVYPVPDGDTGTNMLLTMRSAVAAMEQSPEKSVGALARAAAHGALMGARGNSGVILSQFLKGLAQALEFKAVVAAQDFAEALAQGAAMACLGIVQPVEGTMITVGKDAAAAALLRAKEDSDVVYVLQGTVIAARESVARTPLLLDVLRDAGVVDAGGQGLYLILEGMLRCLRGEMLNPTAPADQGAPVATDPIVNAAARAPHEESFGYCTEFLVEGHGLDLEQIRARVATMGDSAIAVGDENVVRVHVHTTQPGRVVEYGTQLGTLHQIKIDNMEDQHPSPDPHVEVGRTLPVTGSVSSLLPAGLRAPLSNVSDRGIAPIPGVGQLAGIATVAVVQGDGLEDVLRGLGVMSIVQGGQTMNPSTEDLLGAVEGVSCQDVILLPNNCNVILAAKQVQSLTRKHLVVVPTETVPQGIAALLAFNYQADLSTNAVAMERAAKAIRTGETTVAVRSGKFDGLTVCKGQVLGLLDGRLVAVGDDDEDVVLDLLERMEAHAREIITIYFGQDKNQEQAQVLCRSVRLRFPAQQVELVYGGQPHYGYVVSAD
ncbi:MAG: DAK2 domain-containing protein [Chloroflexi bacterium]|nr:DAK2 domain-containing protein [Chloroflexota bacterium]